MTQSVRLRWPLLAIFLVALAIRLWGYDFGFPYFHHPDESKLVQPALELINFNRLNLHPGHFIYPAAYIYILALTFAVYAAILLISGRVAGPSNVAEFFYSNSIYLHPVGRILSALAGAATTLMAYLAVRELFNRRAALLAATFLAIAYAHVVHSHYATTDIITGLATLAT